MTSSVMPHFFRGRGGRVEDGGGGGSSGNGAYALRICEEEGEDATAVPAAPPFSRRLAAKSGGFGLKLGVAEANRFGLLVEEEKANFEEDCFSYEEEDEDYFDDEELRRIVVKGLIRTRATI